MSDDLRDWEAGDGTVCTFAGVASIPCGPPVKTRVVRYSVLTSERVRRQPLCVNHAVSSEIGASVVARARKVATERLILAHWDEHQAKLAEAVADLVSGA